MTTLEDLMDLALSTGNLHPVQSNEDAIKCFDYVLRQNNSKATGAEVLALATQYDRKAQIQGFSVSTLMQQFRVLNIVFKSKSGKDVKLTNANGNYKDVFAYVYNMDAPDLSELGSIYFEQRKNGTYHRTA